MMRIVYSAIFFLFSSIVFLACNNNRVPDNVLPETRMRKLLWDMIRADMYLRPYRSKADSGYNDTTQSIRLYQKVLALNNTTKEKFAISLAYYSRHTGLLQEVLDSLKAKPQQTKKTDSTGRKQLPDTARRKTKQLRGLVPLVPD